MSELQNTGPMLLAAAVAGASIGLAGGVWIGADGAGTCVKDWQTLITGFLATAAAATTVAVLVWQVRAQQAENERRREGRLRAVRAGMSQDLHQISRYCDAMESALRQASELAREETDARPEPPAFPDSAVANLLPVIEHLKPADGQVIADMLNTLQLTRGRGEEAIRSEYWNAAGADGVLEALVSLHARVDGLYDFARSRCSRVPSYAEADGSPSNSASLLGLSDWVPTPTLKCLVEILEQRKRESR